jgi:YD repeat-containing protein
MKRATPKLKCCLARALLSWPLGIIAAGLAQAAIPDYYVPGLRNAVVLQAEVVWSTCGHGAGIPCTENKTPEAAFAVWRANLRDGRCGPNSYSSLRSTEGASANLKRGAEFDVTFHHGIGADGVACPGSFQTVTVRIAITWHCPATFEQVAWEEGAGLRILCFKPVPPCNPCRDDGRGPETLFGNPLSMTDRTKRQNDVVVPAVSEKGLSFALSYRSDAARWTHNLSRQLFYTGPGAWPTTCVPTTFFSDGYSMGADGCYPIFPLALPSYVYVDGMNSSRFNLWNEGAGFTAGLAGNVSLKVGGDGYVYVFRPDNTVDQFDEATRNLRKRWFVSGGWHEYRYSDAGTPIAVAPVADLLIGASDAFGRSMMLNYSAASVLNRVVDPAGRAHVLVGGDRLQSVAGPDGLSRSYAYNENAFMSGFGRPGMLTGRFDEANVRTATYGYAEDGKVRFTERAAGVGRYEVLAPGNALITPLGQTIQFAWQAIGLSAAKVPTRIERCRPGGPCPEWVETYQYDDRANLFSSTDRLGYRLCREVDSRNLETSVIEGLPAGSGCNGWVAPGSRKTSTIWHPLWRLRAAVAEPSRRTTYVYNGQPDPFDAGALASCAPATARLFDGTPIAALCRQIVQATTDADGSLGFAAPLEPGVPARDQRWTYNEFGQVLTYDGPRTDVVDITTYEYYTVTSFTGTDPNAVGYTRGDLKQTTSPAGHVTRYTLYNKLGQLLEMVDPNGVVTRHTYDLRQRLTSTTVGGETTTFDYWPIGLIKRITQPDGSWVHHDHDDAHRLVAVSDSLGNRITYTLDNMGNRTAESVSDPAGTLRRSVLRGIDALGRVQRLTGREMAP